MTTTKSARFGAKAHAPAAEAISDKYVVTYWRKNAAGADELVSDEHTAAGEARIQYMNQPPGSDPGLWRHAWDSKRERWEISDMIVDDHSLAHYQEVGRKGMAAMRSIIGHRRGLDGRNTIKSLDATLADDSPARPSKGWTEPGEPLVTEDSADCVVCDYLCQVGLTPHHPHLVAVPEQERF